MMYADEVFAHDGKFVIADEPEIFSSNTRAAVKPGKARTTICLRDDCPWAFRAV
jgi:hypothetical protein